MNKIISGIYITCAVVTVILAIVIYCKGKEIDDE